jgi:hypothetical protein
VGVTLTFKDHLSAIENLDNVLGEPSLAAIVTELADGDEGAVF